MAIKTQLCVVVVTALLAGCNSSAPQGTPGAAESFDDWATAFADDWVRASPTMATRSQYFAGAEQDALDRLHRKGLIGDPVGKSKSVVLTDEGLRRSEALVAALFGKPHDA